MAVEVVCPHCNTRLRAPEEARGRKAKCPKCKSVVSIPGSGPGVRPSGPAGGTQAPHQPATGQPGVGQPTGGQAGGVPAFSQSNDLWPFGDASTSTMAPGFSGGAPAGSGGMAFGSGVAGGVQAPQQSPGSQFTGGQAGGVPPYSQSNDLWPFGDANASPMAPGSSGGAAGSQLPFGFGPMPPGSGQPVPDSTTVNPYQPPVTVRPQKQRPARPRSRTRTRPGKLTVGGLLRESMAVFLRAYIPLLVVSVAWWGVLLGAGFATFFIQFQTMQRAEVGQLQEQTAFLLMLATYVVGVVIRMLFHFALLRYLIAVVRGDRNAIGRLIPPIGGFFSYFGASFLYDLFITLGLWLLVVPGIIAAFTFLLAHALVADREIGVSEALASSSEAMRGNRITVCAAGCLALLGSIAVAVATLGIGLLAVLPFFHAFYAVIYLRATGQPTRLDRQSAGGAAWA